jgi:hypothetical protein
MENISNKPEGLGNENISNLNTEKTGRIQLKDLSQVEIIKIFDKLNHEGRQIVIPIGFPSAGKSLFISSLMYYAQRFTGKKWTARDLINYPFEKGNISRDLMVKSFDEQKAYPATIKGTIDLIGVDIEPHKKSLPVLKLAFVDLAGEDLEQIKTDNKGKLNAQIEGILTACELGKPIFCLITPYDPSKGDNNEDTLHQNFINYIHVNMPDLYKVAKFIVIVSQWDKIPSNNKIEVENYIKLKRPSLHNAINSRNSRIIYGEYSVGKLIDALDENEDPMVLIRRIDFEYPHNFWNNLYRLATGKSFESGFLKKLFG